MGIISHCRGKGEYFRLGNENSSIQSSPMVVEGLVGKMVVQVAVGSFHVLALTDTGEVDRFSFHFNCMF